MSFLNTSAKMIHSSRLPANTTLFQALAMLSDYEFFLSCDPHLAKFEPIFNTTATSNPPPALPDNAKPRSRSGPGNESQQPTCYRVTDIVHAIPAGIWDTNVVSTYEFTDLEDGVLVRIRSPLSIVMDTVWQIREVKGGDGEGEGGENRKGNGPMPPGLELVEDITIRCSRLLVGIVKGQCENGWAGIHAKMIKRLERELAGGRVEGTNESNEMMGMKS